MFLSVIQCASRGTVYCNYFHVLNGVKRGGVLSLVLFAVYIDDLLHCLARSGV